MNKIYIQKYLQLTNNAFSENKILKICFVLMLGITIINSYQTSRMMHHQKTIIVPGGLSFAFEVSESKANHVYYKQMTRYILNLYGCIDAGNVKSKYNELLMLVHPKDYGRMKDELSSISKQYEKYNSVSHNVFLHENIPINIVDDKKLIVKAIKERIVGDSILKKLDVEYTIDFKIEDGRFWLTNLKEVHHDD